MPDLGLDMYKLSDVEKWNGKLEQASDSQVLSTKYVHTKHLTS
jgi:hypothetical protein